MRLNRKPKRILWLSDNPTVDTAFAKVTREILSGLQKLGYSVSCLGRGFDGWPYDLERFPYSIIPTGEEYFGSRALGRAIELLAPQVVVAFGDIWMVNWIKDIPQRRHVFLIGYIPIDGGPLPFSWRAVFQDFDRVVSCSKFGMKQISALVPGMQIEMIYHGVDPNIFRPLIEREAIRSQHGFAGKFVVGCVARNQLRKQFPSLIKAFSRFHAEHPDSVLYLHTFQESSGWVLDEFIAYYRVNNAVRFTPGLSGVRGVPDEQLNVIYNLFDVLVLPTAGEGFGLPILEAMAAGIPVIATHYSACIELVQGRGELIRPKAFTYLGPQIVENALVDVDDLYQKLCILYNDGALRQEYSKVGRKFSETLNWDSVLEKWDALLSSV